MGDVLRLRSRKRSPKRCRQDPTAKWTKGGLTKADLMVNPKGKVVSKKMYKKVLALKGKSGWMTAVMQARKELGITGFCLLNRGAMGVALYKKAKSLYN